MGPGPGPTAHKGDSSSSLNVKSKITLLKLNLEALSFIETVEALMIHRNRRLRVGLLFMESVEALCFIEPEDKE